MAPEKCQANRKNVRDNRKKDRIGITPKTPESLYPCGFAGCPRARAQKNKKKQEKNQQKSPLLKPGLWATLGAAGVPCTGHPCGVPPRPAGAAPLPPIEPPEGGELAPRLRGAAPGAASPCLPALAGGNLGSRAARRFACFVLPLGRAWGVPGQSRDFRGINGFPPTAARRAPPIYSTVPLTALPLEQPNSRKQP